MVFELFKQGINIELEQTECIILAFDPNYN